MMNRIFFIIIIILQNENKINLDQNNCLQPLQIPDVEHELVPPPCTSAKSNTNRFAGTCLDELINFGGKINNTCTHDVETKQNDGDS